MAFWPVRIQLRETEKKKGIDVPTSFVDGSWTTYVIHIFLHNKFLSNLAPFHLGLEV